MTPQEHRTLVEETLLDLYTNQRIGFYNRAFATIDVDMHAAAIVTHIVTPLDDVDTADIDTIGQRFAERHYPGSVTHRSSALVRYLLSNQEKHLARYRLTDEDRELIDWVAHDIATLRDELALYERHA